MAWSSHFFLPYKKSWYTFICKKRVGFLLDQKCSTFEINNFFLVKFKIIFFWKQLLLTISIFGISYLFWNLSYLWWGPAYRCVGKSQNFFVRNFSEEYFFLFYEFVRETKYGATFERKGRGAWHVDPSCGKNPRSFAN